MSTDMIEKIAAPGHAVSEICASPEYRALCFAVLSKFIVHGI